MDFTLITGGKIPKAGEGGRERERERERGEEGGREEGREGEKRREGAGLAAIDRVVMN